MTVELEPGDDRSATILVLNQAIHPGSRLPVRGTEERE